MSAVSNAPAQRRNRLQISANDDILPLVMPPSIPPARFEERANRLPRLHRSEFRPALPSHSFRHSPLPCRSQPPSPPEWTSRRAPISRPAFRPIARGCPSPAGTPRATTSKTPPTESPACKVRIHFRFHAAIRWRHPHNARAIPDCCRPPRFPPSAAARSSRAWPTAIVWLRTVTSNSRKSNFARAPAATRAAVSRADARSSM